MLRIDQTHKESRTARLQVRVSSNQKDFFRRAAKLSGRTLSQLIIDSVQAAAAKIVREHEVACLSREEQVAFVSALLTLSEPAPRLQKAVQSYRQKAGL